jgi:hypothetical protein
MEFWGIWPRALGLAKIFEYFITKYVKVARFSLSLEGVFIGATIR